jgi:hypothetical protein
MKTAVKALVALLLGLTVAIATCAFAQPNVVDATGRVVGEEVPFYGIDGASRVIWGTQLLLPVTV